MMPMIQDTVSSSCMVPCCCQFVVAVGTYASAACSRGVVVKASRFQMLNTACRMSRHEVYAQMMQQHIT